MTWFPTLARSLDEHYNTKPERGTRNHRMNLTVVFVISLRSTVSIEDENQSNLPGI